MLWCFLRSALFAAVLCAAGCSHSPARVCLEAAPQKNLVDVWGSGRDDVYVVGGLWDDSGTPAVLHWDGTCWASLPTPMPGLAVGGSGPDDVWLVGPGSGAAHWNSHEWSDLAIAGSGATYYVLWVASPADVWVGGESPTTLTPLLAHWDGFSWTENTPPGWTSMLGPTAIWGSGANDVWATAEDGQLHAGWLFHWDGTAWQSYGNLESHESFHAGWSAGPGDMWVTRDTLDTGGMGLFRMEGGRWSRASCATQRALFAIGGTGPADIWMTTGTPDLVHWDGTACADVATGTYSILYAVWAGAPDDVWAVGEQGTIVHWDGTAWSNVL